MTDRGNPPHEVDATATTLLGLGVAPLQNPFSNFCTGHLSSWPWHYRYIFSCSLKAASFARGSLEKGQTLEARQQQRTHSVRHFLEDAIPFVKPLAEEKAFC